MYCATVHCKRTYVYSSSQWHLPAPLIYIPPLYARLFRHSGWNLPGILPKQRAIHTSYTRANGMTETKLPERTQVASSQPEQRAFAISAPTSSMEAADVMSDLTKQGERVGADKCAKRGRGFPVPVASGRLQQR